MSNISPHARDINYHGLDGGIGTVPIRRYVLHWITRKDRSAENVREWLSELKVKRALVVEGYTQISPGELLTRGGVYNDHRTGWELRVAKVPEHVVSCVQHIDPHPRKR